MQLTSIFGEQPGVGGGVAAQVACAKQAGGRLRLEECNTLLSVINKPLAVIAAVSIRYELDIVANACQFVGHEAALHTTHPRIHSMASYKRKQHM